VKEHIGLPTLPLPDEEKFHLQTIYGTRLRNLGLVYCCLVMAALYASLAGFSKPKVRYRAYDYEIAGASLTREQTGLIIAGLLQAIVVGSCGRMFFKRVRPFRKDVQLGVKEIVSYTIVKKRYFEHTGQCFFSFPPLLVFFTNNDVG
jgi:hypothetical protein